MFPGNKMEGGIPKTCPVHGMLKNARCQLENHGMDFTKVSLVGALEMSLKTRAYVADFVEDFVPEYRGLNDLEKNKVEKYILIADLLKRGLWDDLKNGLFQYLDSDFDKELKNSFPGGIDVSSWGDQVYVMNLLVLSKMSTILDHWSQELSSGKFKDEMYAQRYGELELATAQLLEPDGTKSSPRKTLASGLRTGLEYPMGMMKDIPNLLKKKGKEVTIENIKEVFFHNLTRISSTFAVHDIVTFGTVDTAMNGVNSITRPSDFSSEYFELDENNNIVFSEEGAAKVSVTGDVIAKIRTVEDQNMNVTQLGCPILFSNIMVKDYKVIFEPIFEKVAEMQKEYK
jgi:hypothetical protein